MLDLIAFTRFCTRSGSSDLWVAASDCQAGCGDVPTFTSSSSSTFKNLSRPFSITYGSGGARGDLVSDTVQMAGFSVPDQVFGMTALPLKSHRHADSVFFSGEQLHVIE